MLCDDHRLISVDDHIVEHPRVWLDRLPSKWAEAAPVMDIPFDHRCGGGATEPMQQWVSSGVWTATACSRRRRARRCGSGASDHPFGAMRPGCYDPKARLLDMDLKGCGPSLFSPAGRLRRGPVPLGPGPRAGYWLLRAFNDFTLEEWCPTEPQRFIPLVVTPFWDLDAAVAELQPARQGGQGLQFPRQPGPPGIALVSDRPLGPAAGRWQREADLPVCMHFGSGTVKHRGVRRRPHGRVHLPVGFHPGPSMVELIFSPPCTATPTSRSSTPKARSAGCPST